MKAKRAYTLFPSWAESVSRGAYATAPAATLCCEDRRRRRAEEREQPACGDPQGAVLRRPMGLGRQKRCGCRRAAPSSLAANPALSADEIATLLRAIEGHGHQWLWTTMLATGIRFGEAAALRWSDVDLDARVINVRHTLGVTNRGPMFAEPKTTKARRLVPLPQIAVHALAAQLDRVKWDRAAARDKWQELDLVFPAPSGRPLSQSHVLERFHRVLVSAGVPRRRSTTSVIHAPPACSRSASMRELSRICSATAASKSQ